MLRTHKTVNVVGMMVLIASTLVGCGPEVVALSAAATQIAPIAGTIGGTVLLVKTIEGMSLDNEKKSLEIQALQNSDSPRP